MMGDMRGGGGERGEGGSCRRDTRDYNGSS